MRVRIVTVGRAGRLFSDLTTEYEGRARRYWSLDIVEVREERARRGLSAEEVRGRESRRLTEKVQIGRASCRESAWISVRDASGESKVTAARDQIVGRHEDRE